MEVDAGARLPWVEKYRPQTLADVCSHEDITRTRESFVLLFPHFSVLDSTISVNKWIETNSMPHLLFYGPPGTGTFCSSASFSIGQEEFVFSIHELGYEIT